MFLKKMDWEWLMANYRDDDFFEDEDEVADG